MPATRVAVKRRRCTALSVECRWYSGISALGRRDGCGMGASPVRSWEEPIGSEDVEDDGGARRRCTATSCAHSRGGFANSPSCSQPHTGGDEASGGHDAQAEGAVRS